MMKRLSVPEKTFSKSCECVPCDLPPLCRNHYFTGKLLTERDLSAEQRYHVDKLRLHHLALHGWGVACGLMVGPHPHCPDRRLVIEPGFAIDRCGREIWLPERVEIELPEAVAPPADFEPCPPDPGEDGAEGYEHPADQDSPNGKDDPDHPYDGDEPKEPELCDPPVPLYVCLCYRECETEFMPAPFDECSCTGDVKKPNRICESYCLELSTEKPEGWDEKDSDHCPVDDCADLYDEIHEPCPCPGGPSRVPLALISDYRPGQVVTAEDIDNSCRQLLPSTRLLDRLIRCILEKLPTKQLTTITDLGWTHGGEYYGQEFLKHYVGHCDERRSFDVVFSAPVRGDRLDRHSFQATVVQHKRKGELGGFLEVVPADVTLSEDGTRASLSIDPDYAERCLGGKSFDLYLTLRCGMVLDERGCAVDGNLRAQQKGDGTDDGVTPSGDGIPGGNMESWITVVADKGRRKS